MPSFRQPAVHRRQPQPTGFDFTYHMRVLCDDLVRRLPELSHVDLTRVAISFCQTRKAVSHGIYASLTPMRFSGGREHTVRRGRRWGLQRLFDPGGREMLYILSFYLPRFLDLDLRRKLTTVVHELWHIGPRFDGDVRRYHGRCWAHSASQRQYDRLVDAMADRWWSLDPPPSTYEFLMQDFQTLVRGHGAILGRRVPAPKLLLLEG
jgi:predicted metallopeptidase